MEQRAFQRIPSSIKTRFYCNNTDYTGTITDISENGMFISTDKVSFPFESELEIFIRQKALLIKVPVKICRLTKSDDVFDGMGVKVIHPVPDYLTFVQKKKKVFNKTVD